MVIPVSPQRPHRGVPAVSHRPSGAVGEALVPRRAPGGEAGPRPPRRSRYPPQGSVAAGSGQNRRALTGRGSALGLAYLIDSSRPAQPHSAPGASRRLLLTSARRGPADRIRSTCCGTWRNAGRGGDSGTGDVGGAVGTTPVPTRPPRGTDTPGHRRRARGAAAPPISPTGPEIPLSSYPPAAPPAPFPVDPKAGPAPPQPGFTPMAMYPPPGPAQYPVYPSGPPVYNPTAPPPYAPAQPSYPGA
ncbi:basic proline-rich protein-like [Neopelma chrysocephalum]|uniref:basic proline-rich protein-like n=1 Tax=Neopelma chrysocephalum TaxID=114329 RepID=UPI000FCCFBD5|nr:basic proline-rich protein-like [Neopelma chrysocephalum]